MPSSGMQPFADLKPVVLIDGIPDQEAAIIRAFRNSQRARPMYALLGDESSFEALVHSVRDSAALAMVDLESLQMPLGDLAKRLRETPFLAHAPKVLLIPASHEGDFEEPYRLGFHSVVVKPAEMEKLQELVDEVFRYWLKLNYCV